MESDRELGNGYYHLPKYESIDVGYPDCEAIIYKSTKEYVFSDIIINGDVIDVEFDSEHIISKRDPIINMDKNTGILEYYVIVKKSDKLIGPLTIKEFEQTINDLNIKLDFK